MRDLVIICDTLACRNCKIYLFTIWLFGPGIPPISEINNVYFCIIPWTNQTAILYNPFASLHYGSRDHLRRIGPSEIMNLIQFRNQWTHHQHPKLKKYFYKPSHTRTIFGLSHESSPTPHTPHPTPHTPHPTLTSVGAPNTSPTQYLNKNGIFSLR